MTDAKRWTREEEKALKALIRDTIEGAVKTDPASVPHRVKAALRGRATGDLDVDAYVAEVMRERQRGR